MSTIREDIDLKIPTNNNREITAAILRELLNQFVDIIEGKVDLVNYNTHALATAALAGRTRDAFVKIAADEVNNEGEKAVYYFDATDQTLGEPLFLGFNPI